MNKFAEPLTMGTSTSNPEPSTLTFEALKKTVDALKAEYPLAGMEPVESRWIPEGMTMLMSRTQIAFCRDGKIVVIDKPNLFKPMPPRF